MTIRSRACRYALAVCCVCMLAAKSTEPESSGADSILGHWYSEGKEGKVEVYKDKGKYYGKIVWIAETHYPKGDPEAGKPKHDRYNPDPARRNDPIVGMVILKNFVFDGDDTWEKGTVYDPYNGKTYKSYLTFAKDGKTLKLRGYIGISMIGRTSEWTRASNDEGNKEAE